MNFWEKQRSEVLGISQRKMAARIGVSNSAISSWEVDQVIPTTPIAELARAYEVNEKIIERELIAQRRRIEAKTAAAVNE